MLDECKFRNEGLGCDLGGACGKFILEHRFNDVRECTL